MSKPCSFWLTIWPVAQTTAALTRSKSQKIEILKEAVDFKALNDSNFQSAVFFPVHYPQTLWINQCVQPISSLIPLVIQSCPSRYPAPKNKAKIYMLILPSFALAGFQKHGKEGKTPHHLRKLLKWSWSSHWFLNTTGLVGNWTWAGSSRWDRWEMHVKERGEEERIFSQNRVHPLVTSCLRSLEMKITWLWNTHRLFRKAADNSKYKGGYGNGFLLCKITCYWIDWIVIQKRWFWKWS